MTPLSALSPLVNAGCPPPGPLLELYLFVRVGSGLFRFMHHYFPDFSRFSEAARVIFVIRANPLKYFFSG